jgi:hypothetical protein
MRIVPVPASDKRSWNVLASTWNRSSIGLLLAHSRSLNDPTRLQFAN